MSSRLIEYTEPHVFYDAVIDRLLKSEAECCAQIGLAGRMAREGYSPISADELDRPLLWAVKDGAEVDAVVLQTLKKSMIVSRGSDEAMESIAAALVSRHWSGQFIFGVTPSIELLAERYASLCRRKRTLILRLRTFQLNAVVWPASVGGAMRQCEPADRELLARYIAGFESDINEFSEEDPYSRAGRVIADRRMFCWADPEPVAMAAFAGPTPNGIRVNFVYTPPEFRGRGYASNLVAHLSQHLLDQRRQFCFLFTDQANPTSNSIYQKIGYRPVSDSERWGFSGDER